jgi:hypothetical protein
MQVQSRVDYVSPRPFTLALGLVIAINAAVHVGGFAGVALTGALAWLPTIALLVASSAWVYRVHRNARALGAGGATTGFRFSAGSAAIVIVIPFANLYASRLIYQELWMLCTGRSEPRSRLVLWWWRLLMFGLVLVLGLGFASGLEPGLTGARVVVTALYPLATMSLYLVLIAAITKRQMAARTRQLALSDAAPAASPPPTAMPRLSFINLEGIIGVGLLVLLVVVSLGASAALQSLDNARRSMRTHTLKQLYTHALMLQVRGELPDSVGPTPPLGTCCAASGCRSDRSVWNHPSWKALDFSAHDPRESYEFVRTGEDFKVIVYADSDCDRTYAKLEMSSLTGEVITEENPLE